MGAHALSDWEALGGGVADEVLLAAADPSHVVGHPSGVLRNALLLAAVRWRTPRLRVVAVRERGGRPDAGASQLFDVVLPAVPPGVLGRTSAFELQQPMTCYARRPCVVASLIWLRFKLCT